jgi:hypothetical protein
MLGGSTTSTVDRSGFSGATGGRRALVVNSIRRSFLMVHVPQVSGCVLLDSLDNNGGVGRSNLPDLAPELLELPVARHANRFRLYVDPASQEAVHQLVTPKLLDLLVGLGGGLDLELSGSDIVVTCERALTSASAPDIVPRLMAVRLRWHGCFLGVLGSGPRSPVLAPRISRSVPGQWGLIRPAVRPVGSAHAAR